MPVAEMVNKGRKTESKKAERREDQQRREKKGKEAY